MRGAPIEVREVAPEDMLSRLHFATTQGRLSMLNANSSPRGTSKQLSLLF